jgi:hypothetical protein
MTQRLQRSRGHPTISRVPRATLRNASRPNTANLKTPRQVSLPTSYTLFVPPSQNAPGRDETCAANGCVPGADGLVRPLPGTAKRDWSQQTSSTVRLSAVYTLHRGTSFVAALAQRSPEPLKVRTTPWIHSATASRWRLTLGVSVTKRGRVGVCPRPFAKSPQ